MFLRRCVSAALVMAFVYLPCRAGIVPVKPAQPTAAAEAAARDVVLTIQARRRLLKDRELGTLNVGVRVRNRVAVLWGPVPSVELALKAESCVREMFEIVEIRNELFVGGDDLTRAKSSIGGRPVSRSSASAMASASGAASRSRARIAAARGSPFG